MSNPINVFVYGTLLFPEITQRLGIVSHGSSLKRLPAVLRGYQRETVAARAEANPPAIFEDSGGSVAGEVLLDITTESLQRLDWFEDVEHELYTRQSVQVEVQPKEPTEKMPHTMEVFTYVCGQRIRHLLNGVWDPAIFRAKHLEWYLANVLPEDGLP